MNNMKRSMKRVFWLLFTLFLLLVGSLWKLLAFDRSTIIINSYNPRLNYDYNNVKRGEIKDYFGEAMAISTGTLNQYIREYPFRYDAAHITGYTGLGKTGLEAAENFELQKIHNETLQRINFILHREEIKGNSIVTTIHMNIQEKASDLMGKKKGAIIVMEPSTGKILAMVSGPDFDPNRIVSDWDALRENEDSPLINRAASGAYPPGSTFKLVTALAAMRNLENLESFTYECTGEATFENKVIHCFDNTAHGTVDVHKAIALSCNCFFAELGKKVGAEKLIQTATDVGLNQRISFSLGDSNGSILMQKDALENEIVETAIGQGRTSISPLSMAVFVSSIANGGQVMQPYIVDHVEYYNKKVGKITLPKKLITSMTVSEANKLAEMMIEAVNTGTGTAAAVDGYQVAGQTGPAQNPNGSDHSWFVGFAPADNPQIAVVVVLENSEQVKAAPLAGKLIQYTMEELNP